MLGARTKQVVTYGRRGRRIVDASDEHDRREKLSREASADPLFTPSSHKSIDATYICDTSPMLKLIAKPKPVQESGPSKPSRKTMMKSKRSPKVAKIGKAEVALPVRIPLAVFSPNVQGSPSVPSVVLKKKRKVSVRKGSPLKSSSPIVNLDILVLDNQGRRISQERRVSRTNVLVNGTRATSSTARARKQPRYSDVSSDANESLAPKPAKMKRGSKWRPIVLSDESDSETDHDPQTKLPRPNFDESEPPMRVPAVVSITSSTPSPQIQPRGKPSLKRAAPPPKAVPVTSPAIPPAPVFVAWTPKPIIPTFPLFTSPSPPPQRIKAPNVQNPYKRPSFLAAHSPIPRPKAHKLTPYRARPGRAALFPAPPSPPSPTTPADCDFDLSLDFEGLTISPATVEGARQSPHLLPLLAECSQDTPHEFSAFIELFPLDPIVQGEGAAPSSGSLRFQKIGEASYSEVFGIGDVVLKVIPLRDEEQQGGMDDADADAPAPSDAKDVLKEMIVTGVVGDMCPGFVRLLRTYVVRGKYPSVLLDLWDEYHAKKGSESVRPDSFGVSQVYAIIVLPNGGPDLETFVFKAAARTGWRQACSLFWQVTRTLATAEELVRFEHRDLHWGQILVKTVPGQPALPRRKGKIPMDDEAHGIEATVIDLGLARMEAADADQTKTHWTPFEQEIFEGEGDYQFDVYRMMRVHNQDSWREYRPLTNVMWLHYLTLKLLHSKRLRPPPVSRKTGGTSGTTFTERECYNCLMEMEEVLGRSVASCKPQPANRKPRRKTQAQPKLAVVEAGLAGLAGAADVLQLAVERGWICSE